MNKIQLKEIKLIFSVGHLISFVSQDFQKISRNLDSKI